MLKRDDGEHNASDHYDGSNHGRPQATNSAHRLPGRRGRRGAHRRPRRRVVIWTPTFGIGGKVTTDLRRSTDIANAVAIQADGKLVVVDLDVGRINNRRVRLRRF